MGEVHKLDTPLHASTVGRLHASTVGRLDPSDVPVSLW